MLKVVQRLYANHWPIWCVVDGDRVILCRETEREAKCHLDESQRGMVAANIANMPNGGSRNEQHNANLHGASEAAAMMNVSERRAGEMLRDMDKAKGNQHVNSAKCNDVTKQKPTLSEIGITKRQSKTDGCCLKHNIRL